MLIYVSLREKSPLTGERKDFLLDDKSCLKLLSGWKKPQQNISAMVNEAKEGCAFG